MVENAKKDKTVVKKEKKFIWIGSSHVEKISITNIEKKEEYRLQAGGKIFDVKIEWNESRQKYHAVIKMDGKVNSLSFFVMKSDAVNNINLWVATVLGIAIQKVKGD